MIVSNFNERMARISDNTNPAKRLTRAGSMAACPLIFLIAAPLFAQVTVPVATLSIGPPSAPSVIGQNTQLPINLTGSTGLNIASLTFMLTAPAGGSFDPAQVSPAGPQPPKATICFNAIGPQTNPPATASNLNVLVCTVAGITTNGPDNTAPLVDGQIATVTLKLGTGTAVGPLTIVMSGTDAAAPISTTDSQDVPLGSANGTFPVGFSACDLNQDGVVSNADVLLAIQSLNSKTPLSVAWAVSIVNVNRIIQAVMTGMCNAR